MYGTRKLILFSLLILAFLGTSACLLNDGEKQAIEDGTSNPPIHQPPIVDRPELGEQCFAEVFQQPPAAIIKNIDILFVVDTSGSLNSEREAIGDGIDAFVDALPSDVDVQFGVMLGHVGARTGALYRFDDELPLVLRSADYTNEDLRAILRNRMKNVASESVTDGGEAGLYSLSRAFDEDKLPAIQAEGFFRADAALAIVFVADENDICARFPEGITPVFDPNLKEGPAFDNFCADVTAESTFQKVINYTSGLPFIGAGIIYHEGAPFPNSGENEIGYGYNDFIDLANGITIDLSGGSFHTGLDQLGTIANKKLSLFTEFPLIRNDFDPSSLFVDVDGDIVAFVHNQESNQIEISIENVGLENSEIFVAYCLPAPENSDPPVISNLAFSEIGKTAVLLTWTTDIPATSQVEISNVFTGATQLTTATTVKVTSHRVTVSGLTSNTLYFIRAISENDGASTASEARIFRTLR